MQSELIDFLLQRRSSRPDILAAPGPGDEDLKKILTAAARVPDHKQLVPWRFIIFSGDARAQFGERLVDVYAREAAQTPSDARLETERERFLRAPVVICVVIRIERLRGVPELEQVLSTGAACYNLCLAANALGFGTSWITEWYAFSPGIRDHLKLGDDETAAGFIYIGTASKQQPERRRPVLEDIVTHWNGE